jgi:hypothetical protein
MRWGTLLLAVASITAGSVTTAHAADVSVGAPASATPVDTQACAGTGCIAAARDAVPADGRIVSWHAIGDGDGIRLRILRPNADGSLTAVGSSAPETISGLPADHPTDLPVRRGDRIGIEVPGSGSGPSVTPVALAGTAVQAPVFAFTQQPGGAFDYLPVIADGASGKVLGSVTSDAELLVSATLRTPDAAPATSPKPSPQARKKHKRKRHRRHHRRHHTKR